MIKAMQQEPGQDAQVKPKLQEREEEGGGGGGSDLPIVAVRKHHHKPRLPQPFGFSTGKELVENDLQQLLLT